MYTELRSGGRSTYFETRMHDVDLRVFLSKLVNLALATIYPVLYQSYRLPRYKTCDNHSRKGGHQVRDCWSCIGVCYKNGGGSGERRSINIPSEGVGHCLRIRGAITGLHG